MCRRCRYLGEVLHAMALALAACSVLIVAGWGGAQHAAQKQAPPRHDKPLSGLFKITAERSMFLKCSGSGRPTIVMDAGMGNDHHAWDGVVPALSKLTRTCAFDRAAEGLSDFDLRARTLRDSVSDLKRLLGLAGVAPPYLLVGHSFGGLETRLFASEHPRDVVGLVVVDATPTSLLDDACSITVDLCDLYRGSWASNPENVKFEVSLRQVKASRLPHIPLTVMSATNHSDPSYDARINRLFEAQWQSAQQRLAESVPGGKLQVVQGGHGIQDEHPRLVIAAIRTMLEKTR